MLFAVTSLFLFSFFLLMSVLVPVLIRSDRLLANFGNAVLEFYFSDLCLIFYKIFFIFLTQKRMIGSLQ